MNRIDREKVQIEIVKFVKANPGRCTRPGILRRFGHWNRTRSSALYKLFVPLVDSRLVRLERTGDGLLKVYPGDNAKHFGGG